MKYTEVALKNKIEEMYPDIVQHHVTVGVAYNEEKRAYVLQFKRGKNELITYLDKMDADDCMTNIKCIHLGIKVDQFIGNFEAREVFSRKVA